MKNCIRKVDLSYHSAHKFRHGHTVYALKQAKDIAALKAISQNLMHKNLAITGGVYGILSETDVKEQILTLRNRISLYKVDNVETIKDLMKQLLEKLG